MNLGHLLVRVLHTLIDILIIGFVIGVGFLAYRIVKELRSLIDPRRIRIFKKFAKTEGFSIERLEMGMWTALGWSVTFKRGESFLTKPVNNRRQQLHLSDFPEGLRGGLIAFSKASKEIISLRFHNTFPDDFYDAVFFVIDSLIGTVARKQKKEKTFLAYGSSVAMSFGLLLHTDWKDYLTKEVFDENSYCLDVAGIGSEFLFLLVAELLKIFGQKAALVTPEDFGGVWVVRPTQIKSPAAVRSKGRNL
jgi:hypothetical protein